MWRRLSVEAWELIRRLQSRPTWWQRLAHGPDPERHRAVTALAELRELASVMFLIEFAADPDQEVARTARAAVAALTAAVPRSELPRLDDRVRGGMSTYGVPTGRWPEPLSLDLRDEPAVACLGLVSCTWDGHVREAAVARLARAPVPLALPWLLLRVNDWVPAVRIRATTAVLGFMDAVNAPALVANLELVMRLESCGRADHAPLIGAVSTLLREPAARPAVLEGLRHDARGVREVCADLLLGARDVDPVDIARRVRRDPAVGVRLLTARACRQRLDQRAYAPAFELLAADPFPVVRAEMLEGLAERDAARAQQVLPPALFDRSAAVRYTVRHLLTRLSPALDVRAAYHERLPRATGSDLTACLLGLAETGAGPDAATVRPFVSHPRSSVRAAAVRALAHLAPNAEADLFLQLVHDRSAGVSRAAAEALRSRLHLLGSDALWQAFERDETPHVRRRLLSLFARLSKWRQLNYCLRAVTLSAGDQRRVAVAAVEKWLSRANQSFASASGSELEDARAELARARPSLPPHVVETITWMLTS
jgi:HEAT repeat protein